MATPNHREPGTVPGLRRPSDAGARGGAPWPVSDPSLQSAPAHPPRPGAAPEPPTMHTRPRPRKDTRPRDEEAASNVVGLLMGLAVVVTLMGPIWLLVGSIMDATQAHQRAAERAAWCAEHPEQEWPGEGDCPEYGPRGWDCEAGDTVEDTLKCVPATDDSREPDDYILIKCDEDDVKEQDGMRWRDC